MFKKYDQSQQFLLPLRLECFVPENNIARILNDIIDAVDITAIESTYSKNGSPAYHPRLMLKILLYTDFRQPFIFHKETTILASKHIGK